ncbi:MAG TPA: fused MFS/spermidine synthase, partial [Anaeromyxobacteraceae bacterium]|nr:fused MFS/spermidine synthase [Anaeromyxobacteraceae bacterium]
GALASRRVKDPVRAFALCELGIGVAGLAVAPLMRGLTPVYIATYYAFHDSFAAFYAIQFLIAFVLMGIPTTLMGATFPLLVRLLTDWRGEPGAEAGRLYAVNTLGGIVGSLAAGFALVPLVGVTRTAAIAGAVNVANALVILALKRRRGEAGAAAVLGAVAVAGVWVGAGAVPPAFSYGYASRFGSSMFAERVATEASRAEVLFHDDGADGEVWLLRGGAGGALTLVNGSKLESGDTPSFALLAQLPWFTSRLMRPARNALNIGLGSGHTLHALAETPIESIDSVEISGGVIEANRRVLNPELFADPRIRHFHADGRNHLLVHREPYDLIVVSPSWAVEEGSAAMLTDQFFAIAASHLSPDGVAGVWVDFSLMDDADMRRVLRAFAKNFRHVTAWDVPGGDVVLVGTNAARYPSEDSVARLAGIATPQAKGRLAVALSDAAPRPGTFDGAYDDDLPVVEFDNARNLVLGAIHGTRRR